MTIIQNERFEYLKKIIERDISTYAGPILEKLFIEIMKQSPKYGLIGTYWEKGNLNEIDIIAIDDILQEIYFAEVKLNKNKIKMKKLKENTKNILKKYDGYNSIYESLSLTDIDRKIVEGNS